MAGSQTTLSLQDKMTGPLMKIMKAMDSTLKVMEQMDASTQKLDQKSLATARKNITNASADLERLRSSLSSAGDSAGKAAQKQEGMNRAVDKLAPSPKTAGLGAAIDSISNSASKATEQQKKLNSAVGSTPAPANAKNIAKAMDNAASSAVKATKGQEGFNKSLNAMKPPSFLERLSRMFKNAGKEADGAAKHQSRFNQVLQQLRPSSILERLRHVIKSAGDAADDAAGKQNRFNESLKGGISGASGLVAGLLSAVGAYQMFNAAKSFFTDSFSRGIDFHAFRQSSEIAFTTFLGDAQLAKQYMDDMYAFALKTPFAYPDLLASSRNLIAFGIEAQNTFPIMQAIGDAVAGIGGGNAEMQNMADIFGVIQAQGRITAMEVNRLSSYGVNAYEMLGKAAGVSAEEMKKQITAGTVGAGQAIGGLVDGMNKKFGGLMEGVKGTWTGAIDSLNSARRNAGAAMMEDFMKPLTDSVGVVTDFFKKIPLYAGPAVAAFLPLVEMFNETFGGDRFDGIFAAIGAALTFIAHILSWVGQTALWVAGVFADNWSWIAPILTVAGAVLAAIVSILVVKYTVLGLIRIATMAWAAAQWVVNQAYLANPIVWVLLIIIAVIALVIYAMVAWAEQTAVVVGYIVGSIMWLGAVVYNILMGIANISLGVAEFFADIWNQAVYEVQMGWINFLYYTLTIFDTIANATISVAEWFANTWYQSLYLVQVAWIAWNVMVRSVLDSIGNAAISAAEWFMNTWSDGVYGVQMAFHQMGKFATTVASSAASAAVGMVNAALGAISNLINSATAGINSMIGLMNKIPGVNISTIGTVDLKLGGGVSNFAANLGSSLEAPVKAAKTSLGRLNMAGSYAGNISMPSAPGKVDFGTSNAAANYLSGLKVPSAPEGVSFDRLDYLDPTTAFKTGQLIGEKASLKASDKLSSAVDKVTGLLSGPGDALMTPGKEQLGGFDPSAGGAEAPGAAGKKSPGSGGKKAPGAPKGGSSNPTGGKLDSIGKINDEINIADEDLKLLRELADRQSIQAITTTLNPTVTFSGDMSIREEADVDKIIRKIEEAFEEEISRSAEGVYT